MRLAVTGFVNESAGSIASANGLRLKGLLDEGFEIDFFSKSSFVDPRPIVGERSGFRFIDCTNRFADHLRRKVWTIPILGFFSIQWDAASYNLLLVRRIREHHRTRKYDLILWLGDFAHGYVRGVPTVSLIQGPPGTDATSIAKHASEIMRISGIRIFLKWRILASLRLRMGMPNLRNTDRFVVGSNWSAQFLSQHYKVAPARISVLAYPIDMKLFSPDSIPHQSPDSALSVLWLGRIIPRKRLDVFLDGAAQAIERGTDLRLTVIGGMGFIPGYERLLESFPFPERLVYRKFVPRAEIPRLLKQHDILAQPSDNEDFGHSIAEAQACGLPVIVGASNGTADYICGRSIHLAENCSEDFADALRLMWERKRRGELGDRLDGTITAASHYNSDALSKRLLEILCHTKYQTSENVK